MTTAEDRARYGAEPNRTPIPAVDYADWQKARRSWRAARHAINRERMPRGWIRTSAIFYGSDRYEVRLDPALLAELSDGELVDLAGGGYGTHFGGHVDRHPDEGAATVTVYID